MKQKPKTETLCSNPPHFWRIECEDLAQVGYCKKCGARKVMVPRPARDERIPVINKVAEANRERVLRG